MQESPKQQKHVHNRQIPALNQAYQVHQDLIKTINEMDIKIEEVIRTHEAQFLLAYRNHIKLMKEQLSLIKQRAEQQQKKMLSNERSLFLEKQIILFREEALKLYDKLQEKTQENQINKTQHKQLEKMKAIMEKENKELLKNIKLFQTKNTLLNSQIAQLKTQNTNLKSQLQRNSQRTRKNLSKGATVNTINEADLYVNKIATPHRQNLNLPMPLDSKKGSRHFYSKGKNSLGSKSMAAKQDKKNHEQILDHQLKNFFLQCLQTIRKEVAQRKVYGYKSQDINLVGSWEEFRMIDKLRLLEMFMQNEKLLVWMYEKIFPNRMSQIQNYFSNRKRIVSEVRPKTKSFQINLDDIALPDGIEATSSIKSDLEEEIGLPKVVKLSEKKKINPKKYDIRSRIEIKSGKLSLKHFSDQKIE